MNIIVAALLLPLGIFALRPEFKPERFVASGKFRLNATAARVFPMFEPVGEKRWAEDWNPIPIYPNDLSPAEGVVFSTQTQGEPSIWTITKYQPGKRIEYSVVSPGHDTTQITVSCKSIETSATEVTVTYRITGLSESGNDFGRSMSPSSKRLWIIGDSTSRKRLQKASSLGSFGAQQKDMRRPLAPTGAGGLCASSVGYRTTVSIALRSIALRRDVAASTMLGSPPIGVRVIVASSAPFGGHPNALMAFVHAPPG